MQHVHATMLAHRRVQALTRTCAFDAARWAADTQSHTPCGNFSVELLDLGEPYNSSLMLSQLPKLALYLRKPLNTLCMETRKWLGHLPKHNVTDDRHGCNHTKKIWLPPSRARRHSRNCTCFATRPCHNCICSHPLRAEHIRLANCMRSRWLHSSVRELAKFDVQVVWKTHRGIPAFPSQQLPKKTTCLMKTSKLLTHSKPSVTIKHTLRRTLSSVLPLHERLHWTSRHALPAAGRTLIPGPRRRQQEQKHGNA